MIQRYDLILFLLSSQGAKRIVSEWPDLDLEARTFTAKILRNESELQETGASDKSQGSQGDEPSVEEVDLESKSEL